MALASENISWGGFAIRFLLAVLLVYGTWNPWGVSFIDWTVMPLVHGDESNAEVRPFRPGDPLVSATRELGSELLERRIRDRGIDGRAGPSSVQ